MSTPSQSQPLALLPGMDYGDLNLNKPDEIVRDLTNKIVAEATVLALLRDDVNAMEQQVKDIKARHKAELASIEAELKGVKKKADDTIDRMTRYAVVIYITVDDGNDALPLGIQVRKTEKPVYNESRAFRWAIANPGIAAAALSFDKKGFENIAPKLIGEDNRELWTTETLHTIAVPGDLWSAIDAYNQEMTPQDGDIDF